MTAAECALLDDLPRRAEVEDRWMSRAIPVDSGCWEWSGPRMRNGYGRLNMHGRSFLAHRIAVTLTGVCIPDGLVVDHVCMNRACVNPDHLDVVTVAENTRRGYAPSIGAGQQLAKTHCPHGHPYSPENTTVTKRGERYCRTCQRDWWTRSRARKQGRR